MKMENNSFITSFLIQLNIDPYIDAMIKTFNLRMPNQNMKPEEVKNIIEYLKWIDENADLQ